MDVSALPVDVSTSFVIATFFMTYFFVGGLLFSARSFLVGRYRDPELEQRGSSAVLILLLRLYFAWLMKPPLAILTFCRIPPNAVTGLSVLLAIVAGVSVARGDFATGGWLYLGSGFCDFLDGRLARLIGQVTPAGSLLDSTLDRYSESAMLIGMIWFYRDNWVLFIFLLFLTGSFLVPYIRARGEALGIETKVGLMQRPERLVTLGLASAFSPILAYGYPAYSQTGVKHPLVVVIGTMLAIATQATAAYRLTYLIRQVYEREVQKAAAIRLTWSHGIAFLVVSVLDLCIFLLFGNQLGLPAWASAGVSCMLTSPMLFFAPQSSAGSIARLAAVVSASVLSASMVAVLSWMSVFDDRGSWLLARAAVTLAWIYPLWLSMKVARE